MKTVLRTAAAGVALASLAVSSAASAATATGDAEALILEALSVTAEAPLEFGTIAESGSGGTVTIATDGTQTCSAGLACVNDGAAAGFAVVGVPDKTVVLSVPSATTTLTIDDGTGATMAVSGLAASSATTLLDGTGDGSFTVGGVLAVGNNQAPGFYAGTFDVTVVYQ
jgi:hypothetical protein